MRLGWGWIVIAGWLAVWGLARVKAVEPVRYTNSTTDSDSVVTFNEVMYQPADGDPRDEWIEVHNQTAVLVDLSAWTLEGGVDFRFPEGTTIPGGGFLVIAADPERLKARTGVVALGPFARRLSDSGDRLVLRNLNRRWMDGLEYEDSGDWPVGADGSGATLAKRVAASPSSPPENWRASVQVGGTPGIANFAETTAPPPVVHDVLLGARSLGRWRVPGGEDAALAWRDPGFVDALWRPGTNGYGFGSNRVSVVPAMARHYRFERTSSDSSGQAVHAVLRNGVRFVAEPAPIQGSEVAIRFDGVDDQVVIEDEVDWAGYTVALWVRFETVRAGSLLVRTDEAGPTVSWSHQLRVTAGRRFEHYTFDGGGKVVTGTTLVEPGRWYHVAATAESGGLARLYVNGLPEGGSEPVATLWQGGSQWRLGTASQGFPNPFQGWLDDVAIWDKALEPASLQTLVQGSGPVVGGSLNAWVATDLGMPMRGVQSSVWIRQAFDAPASQGYDRLTLRMRYDDGFVAWLNGEEVARRNAPDPLTWSSRATAARSDAESVVEEVVDLTGHAGRLRSAGNVLAVQALNVATDDGDLLASMELEGRRRSELVGGGGPLLISEATSADQPGFFCEVANPGAGSVDLNDWVIRSSAGGEFRWGQERFEPGGWRVLGTNELGFAVEPNDRLFLFDAGGRRLVDAVALSRTGRARRVLAVEEPWLRSTHGTPSAANAITLHDEIVINEIFYHAPPRYARPGEGGQPPSMYVENEEQWVELFNRSDRVVDLFGWRLEDEMEFRFAAGTRLGPGEYLVVARKAAELERLHPGIRVVGDWVGRLSGRGGRIRLLDAAGNPADEVRYFDDDPWPAVADGGGSSLELNDPDADNATAGAWSASDESERSTWRTYTYRARAVTPVKAPAQNGFHEFRMGLLAAGEVWVDDLRVVEDPDGAARQLIQNGSFDAASAWRLLGNHSASQVMDDPDRAGNRVLRLVAKGARGYMHNQLETTLKSGGAVVPVVAGRWYEISFRAKWVGGSPLLHTELYYNKVAHTTVLDQPALFGTPGRRNTAWTARQGPTFSELFHEPLVPKPGEPVVVRVRGSDPDGLGAMTLFTSVNGAAWQQRAMVADGDGRHSATVPAQAADAVVQFYVAGVDAGGAVGWMPPRGPDSRALYRVDSRLARAPRKAFRFVLTPADGRLMDATTNMMSDDRVGATVVWDDREVFYDCGVHLHGSMFSRVNLDSVPYSMKFPADRRYRGVHRTVQLNRGVIEEIVAKHAQNQAGIPGMYEDIVDLYSHRRANAGAARLSMAHYNDIYLASQFENGADGLLYNMEGIRVLETTHNRSVEGIKLGMPVGWVSDYDVMNLGDDPEQYRFSTTLRNNRARNDHGPYIAMAKAFSLSGAALEQAVTKVIDVDQWMRYYALLTLFEVGDTYTLGNPHNIGFYARPSDGRLLALPYDWDFFFANGSTSPLWGNQNLAKVIARPVFTRLLHGHLLDLIQGTFTPEYLGPYIANFGQVAGQNYSGYLTRIRARAQYVRGRLPAVVPFEITSNGGADFSVATPHVTLEGRGWIDVRDVRLATGEPVALTWLDGVRWRASIPLMAESQRLELRAFNRRGEPVGDDGIGVTTTQLDDLQRRFLRISEIHYHPAEVSDAERAAGYVDDDFEFVEVTNYGTTAVGWDGLRLEGAIEHAFDGLVGSTLAPGERVLVVKQRTAFERRWGMGRRVVGVYQGSLNNAGEVLRLMDRQGLVIHEVAYDDADPWPSEADGAGYSLELIAPDGAIGVAAGWRVGVPGGSPGQGWEDLLRPRFVALRVDGDWIRLRLQGWRGQEYQVQTASALVGAPWENVGTPVRVTEDGEMEWEGAKLGDGRFFRISVERVAVGVGLGQSLRRDDPRPDDPMDDSNRKLLGAP